MSDYVGPYSAEYYELPYRQSYDEPSLRDLISQGIDLAGDVAKGVWGDYVYPDDPRYRPNVTVYPQPTPQPGPAPAPGLAPQPSTQPRQPGGVTLSTNTLLILGLVGFAFVFGRGKK